MDVTAAGTTLANSVIGAVDGAARDLIDIESDRSIAKTEKSAEIEQKAWATLTDASGKEQSMLVLSEKRNTLRSMPTVVKLTQPGDAGTITGRDRHLPPSVAADV